MNRTGDEQTPNSCFAVEQLIPSEPQVYLSDITRTYDLKVSDWSEKESDVMSCAGVYTQ